MTPSHRGRRPRTTTLLLGTGQTVRTEKPPKRALEGRRAPERPKTTTEPATVSRGVQRLILEGFPDPKLARSLSPNGRVHWATKKRAQDTVYWLVGHAIFEQRLTDELQGCRVRITYRWIVPDRRRRDLDNHTTGVVKAVQDALVEHALIDADDTSCVVGIETQIVYEQGRRALVIEIEEVQV